MSDQIDVSQLDISGLKASLIEHFSNTIFRDYNFNGSAINIILDLLCADTYKNSFLKNMLFNEAFLDTALIRASVLSKAKELGYLPISAKGAEANVTISISPNTTPDYITIPKYTRFQANSINGYQVLFNTLEDYTLTSNSGTYTGTIIIREGTRVTQTFVVPSYTDIYSVVLNNDMIDIETLEVSVKLNANSTSENKWTRIENILEADSNTLGFFISENKDSLYELQFGNGIVGKKLSVGNIIEASYNVTLGEEGNDINGFMAYDAIYGTTSMNISVNSRASEGRSYEDITSIKYNAPKSYTVQDRAVTTFDFEQKLNERFPEIESLNIWGGEDNEIPLYGRVVIAVKPYGGYATSNKKKLDMIKYLRSIQMQGPDPIIIDPTPIYITPHITIEYDKDMSTLNPDQVLSLLNSRIQSFMASYVGDFGKEFYSSKFSTMIDNTDTSIISNELNIDLTRSFYPTFNEVKSYIIAFNQSIIHPYVGFIGAVNSSAFRISNSAYDMFIDDDGRGNIRMYYIKDSSKVFITEQLGTVDYTTGKIVLTNFTPINSATGYINISVIPRSKNVTSGRNIVLIIIGSEIKILEKITGKTLAYSNPTFLQVPAIETMEYGNVMV
jgi:hypothetical protein